MCLARATIALALSVGWFGGGGTSWAEPSPRRSEPSQADERFWQSIAAQPPPETMSLRRLFLYLRTLAEQRLQPERVERVVDLAIEAQDRDPQSPTYGNFRWLWRDARVNDPNAVEFLMQEAAATWIKHNDWISAAVRSKYRAILERALEACLRHRVPVDYTNIAILNAANTAVLGEILDRSEAADEGYRRLEAICVWTRHFGIAEYCNPTYYAVNLDGLEFLLSFARCESGRRWASALRQLFWTDIAMNFFPAGARLAGTHSRSYDYMRGTGLIDNYLAAASWIRDDLRDQSLVWPRSPMPEVSALHEMAQTRFPRVVRERWGPALRESRTHVLYPDVTLSTSASGYSPQDVPLTIDLSGDRRQARCYFIADGREDPYGKVRVEAGQAKHLKAVHLTPFWAAAQRDCDAVALAVYRAGDVNPAETSNLQSHLVLRRPENGLWLGGKRRTLKTASATGETKGAETAREHHEQRLPVVAGQPIVLRYGTAGVGVRLLWARAQDGSTAEAALVDDGNPFGVIRLTIEHRRDRVQAPAGAAIWVRVGSNLANDAQFDAWRRRFERSVPVAVEASDSLLRMEVPGENGTVALAARSPFGQGGGVVFLPEPTRAVIEVDGREVGRPLLATIGAAQQEQAEGESLRPIDLPAGGRAAWEAEDGLVVHGMAVVDDAGASAGRCVVQPLSRPVARSPGSITWLLCAAAAGRYYLWARVNAPDGETNSFDLSMDSDTDELPPRGPWHLRPHRDWTWQCWSSGTGRAASPVDLPAGLIWLRVRSRESGTKIDRLVLTADPNERPD